MVIGLRQAGVRPAGWVAFLVAAPVLDPVLFGALGLIAGPGTAVLYASVTFVAAVVLALVADAVGIDRHLKPLPATVGGAGGVGGPGGDCERAAHCDVGRPDGEWLGVRRELGPALRAGAGLLRSIGLILLVGVGIGVAIEAFVPPGALEDITTGGGPLAIRAAALAGVPLYFNTELFVPIADSLSDAGVGIGAIVALTIAGAGANVPEFVLLGRLVHRRLLAVLFGHVFVVALVGGLLAQTVMG